MIQISGVRLKQRYQKGNPANHDVSYRADSGPSRDSSRSPDTLVGDYFNPKLTLGAMT